MPVRPPLPISRRFLSSPPPTMHRPALSSLLRLVNNSYATASTSPLVPRDQHRYIIHVRCHKHNTHFTLSYLDSHPTGVPLERAAKAGGILKERESTAPVSEKEAEWALANPYGVRQPYSKVVIAMTPGNLGFKKAQRKSPEAVTMAFLRFISLINHHLILRGRAPRTALPSHMLTPATEDGDEEGSSSYRKHLPAPSLDPTSVYSKRMALWPEPTDIHFYLGGNPIGGSGRNVVIELLTTSKEADRLRKKITVVGDNTKVPLIGVRPKKKRRLQ
ncbi:hypothetical protein BT69DRAFT_1281777 [Atractiella rhizophila]|nr:hypothetical protein BT69DRAFT_820240 [Atractiella rhizophila]KAH8923051.1 hypothetical protein BT69DRAFT_1281777 [Atractiella rhizophila]